MRKIFIYVIVFALLTGGCSKASTVSNTTDSENSKKLVVFMNSTPHTFREYDENGNMIDTVIYPSRYTAGTMLSGGDVNSPNANIFEKALQEYSKESGIEIEVHYLEEEYSGHSDTLQNIVDVNGNLPDLLLLNKQPQYDYYKILELRFQYEYSDFA